MQEGGAAAQVPQDKQWLFDFYSLVTREEDVVQKEREPMDQLSDWPDCIKQEEENDAFAGETSGCVF